MSDPLAYFITFRTYGTWLHGDQRGSVDPDHNIPGTPKLPPDERWVGAARNRMLETPFELDTPCRQAVDEAIRERCSFAGWSLLALNVRTNHVHLLVAASEPADQVMASLKAWSTRRLRTLGLLSERQKVWSRHGSTKRAWKESELEGIIHYILHGQEKQMEV